MDYEKAVNYTLVAELQKALNESNERVNELENMWDELKDFVREEYRKTTSMQEIYAYYEVIKEIEQLEKENERWEKQLKQVEVQGNHMKQ